MQKNVANLWKLYGNNKYETAGDMHCLEVFLSHQVHRRQQTAYGLSENNAKISLAMFKVPRSGIRSGRIGKKTNSSKRPLKFILESREQALNVMRNKRKLREYDNNIKVELDETPMQKNFYKKVKAD
ncbi:hypothetical protein WA026_020757 [Henosepilachna vigintioctopunctata]|uniref:HNH homing endonuclease n=1 Tax=Henosepilachna vigintioctopunctata TaxID=420089 RepID=A0AAW1TNC7_9CUCU